MVNCQEGDILSKAKKAVVNETLNSVKSFLQKLLKVNPMTNPYALNGEVINGSFF